MNQVEVIPIYTLSDNYSYIVHRKGSKRAMVIDASEAAPIHNELKHRDLHLELIVTTHHHHDHVGGNLELMKTWGASIWSSLYDLQRVPGATRGLTDGEKFVFDEIDFEVMMIPGHTLGQIGLVIPSKPAAFLGDTLFAMGCGRVFEGTYEQMFTTLQKIAKLPPETKLYFGHEYTVRNGEFSLSIDQKDAGIGQRIQKRMVTAKDFTQTKKIVPAPTLREELEVNPFLRAQSVERFAELRDLRNSF